MAANHGEFDKALLQLKQNDEQLRNLDLRGKTLTLQQIQQLSLVLKVNSTLTTLQIINKNIGKDGAAAIADALKVNSTLTTLNLDGNYIGDVGVASIGDALKVNSSLTELYLKGNEIGVAGGVGVIAEALKVNSSLTTLNLNDNSIQEDGAVAIAEALKVNTTLTTLDLQFNQIGDDGAAVIAEALKVKSSLTYLDLRNNNIGIDGAIAVAEALTVNSSLTTLSLRNNIVGFAGATAVADSLKVNSSLTTLNLNDTNIGDAGVVAIAEALKVNASLTRLDIDSNIDIGKDGAVAVSEALKVNSTVKVKSSITTLLMDNTAEEEEAAVAFAAKQKKAAEEAAAFAARKQAEEEAAVAIIKKKSEEAEAARKKKAEDAAKRKKEEEAAATVAAKRQKEEEAAAAVAARKKKAEEEALIAARKKAAAAEEEAVRKKKTEEAAIAAAKKKEEEDEKEVDALSSPVSCGTVPMSSVLRILGPAYVQYGKMFHDNGVVAVRDLLNIDDWSEDILQDDIQVKSKLHKGTLLKRIRDLVKLMQGLHYGSVTAAVVAPSDDELSGVGYDVIPAASRSELITKERAVSCSKAEVASFISFKVGDCDKLVELSQGASGVTYLTTYKKTGEKVVVKAIKNEADFTTMWNELGSNLQLPPDEHVLSLKGVCSKPGMFMFRYMPGGSLDKVVTNVKNQAVFRSPRIFLKLALDIALGVQHLHRHKVVHRDLACRNILLEEDGTAVLADFGLAKTITRDVSSSSPSVGGGKAEYVYTYCMSAADTPLPIRWMAPESIRELAFNEKSDVWSLGVTLWEVLSGGQRPYPDEVDNMMVVADLKRGKVRPEVDCEAWGVLPALATLVSHCCQIKVADRPNADGVIALIQQTLSALGLKL